MSEGLDSGCAVGRGDGGCDMNSELAFARLAQSYLSYVVMETVGGEYVIKLLTLLQCFSVKVQAWCAALGNGT